MAQWLESCSNCDFVFIPMSRMRVSSFPSTPFIVMIWVPIAPLPQQNLPVKAVFPRIRHRGGRGWTMRALDLVNRLLYGWTHNDWTIESQWALWDMKLSWREQIPRGCL